MHPILKGLGNEWPSFLGYQRLLPKTDVQTIMTIDDDPFLVVGRFGKGRVAAFASDCGSHWGSLEFYSRFWSQMIRWLTEK